LTIIPAPAGPDPLTAELIRLRASLAAAEGERDRMRQILIEDAIAACTECGSMGFPRKPQCESCVAAVDERIADAARAALEPRT